MAEIRLATEADVAWMCDLSNDEAARTAVRSWRFQPGLRGGRQARVEIVHRVVFQLRPAS